MEARAEADRAFHPDAPGMRFDDVARNRKSEAGAARFARSRGIDAVKSLEDSLQIGLGNADARVGDREDHFAAIRV